jgi:thiol-disulfide isomerase/thioredoxin
MLIFFLSGRPLLQLYMGRAESTSESCGLAERNAAMKCDKMRNLLLADGLTRQFIRLITDGQDLSQNRWKMPTMIGYTIALAVTCLWAVAQTGPMQAATGSLRVKVVDPDGKPAEIAIVQLWIKTETGGRGFEFAAQSTDEPGVFHVEGVPAGRYEGLKIDKPGYAPGWIDEFDVRPNEETRVACVLSRGGTIAGCVVDESGQAVAGTPVVVNSVRCRRDVATDESGRFVAEHLYDTTYSVSAEPKSDSPYALTSLDKGIRPGTTNVRIVLKRKTLTAPQRATPEAATARSTPTEPSLDQMAGASGRNLDAARAKMIGQAAPPLVIERWYNGSFWQLDLNNKVVLLDFWGVWCSPCRRQIPEIRTLAAKYADQGLVVIGIHTQAGKQDLPSFLSQNDVPYLIAVDYDSRTSEAYRVTGYPMIALVDRQGILRAVDPPDLEKEVVGLLAKMREQAPSQ